ncbi:survival motor neuron protein (SMN) domain-containing protein [Pochonia chlamydosporia 170]|uniref:Survival motor neuron protein (SMN) domain-containing protein n=1 Tax=Pochonia chlamydosporia 170 TaxID=1380566 RepID=A0A179FZF5_METCM|nr:survival motor neuron protein (SMN) domain-containing protein [Pochonia chlamydosporia 170]OAQ71055.1 survival motor neuron protein (SMN) domain-containing protein [Pochonia chlamydosporia 170]
MGGERVDLSHEEVWDDSSLIDSWNEALAEYKVRAVLFTTHARRKESLVDSRFRQKYHSIHAKGGSIRDLESKIATHDKEVESNKQANSSEAVSAGNEDPDGNISSSEHGQPLQKDGAAPAPVAPPPQALLGSIRDDNLKKLLMSWYYAGYYTGLFEGQQAQKPQS